MKEGWEYRKLGEFIEEFSVRDKGKGYPVYSVTNTKGFCQEFFGKNVASEDTSNYKVVPRGCFAYNPSRINVGSVAWQNQEENVSVSPLYVVFSVSPKLRKDFLLYYIKSNYSMTFINALSRGAVRNNLRLSTLKTFRIPYAPVSEQQHVVEELNLLSSIIEKKKAQLNELDNLAQSLFYEMFGDPITNEKGWEVKKFRDVYKLKSGDGLSAKQFEDGPYPVYGGNGISGFHKTYNMDGDYIIVGRVGVYCGNVRNVNGKFWLTDNAFQLFYDCDRQIPVFIKYMLTLLDLHQYANKAAQPVISNTTLKDVGILFPPIVLQQQFSSKIEALERHQGG